MTELLYTLLADGPSDRRLMPILTWLLREQGIVCAIQPQWPDLQRLPERTRPHTLSERIKVSINLSPCDILFVHRDAEREPRENRLQEIQKAVALAPEIGAIAVVSVIPVRMQEAWLLCDEAALRRAAGNPNGQHALDIPPLSKIESIPNPKELLHELLREASDLPTRRRPKLPVLERAYRVAELIDDYSPLRQLPAFRALESDVAQVIQERGWVSAPEAG